MNVGKKAEEWNEYFKQLIHNAEYKDEYYQAFQEWPTYDSYVNGTENNSYNNLPAFHSVGKNNLSNFRYIGNNSLPDREIFKPDYSLVLIVFPFIACLVCFVCLFNCCMKRLSNRVTSTSDSREETEMHLVQCEEFQDVELLQHGSMVNIEL